MSWVYFLSNKSEALECFKKFKALTEKQSNEKLKVLRTDRGGEFCSIEFDDFCDEHGIKRELTAPHTPEQNGVAERKNRTIGDMGRSMLHEKNLSYGFWAEAVTTAVYLINLSPTKAVWNKTPFEAWHDFKPTISHLRIFGSLCYASVTSQRHKLEAKTKKCMFVGYCSNSKAYRLYDPEKKKIIVSRHVQFDEHMKIEERDLKEVPMLCEDEDQVQTQDKDVSASTALEEPHTPPVSSPSSPTAHPSSSQSEAGTIQLRRSQRGLVPKKIFPIEDSGDFIMFTSDPFSVETAIQSNAWKEAMLEELRAIERNKTWKLEVLPQDKKAISLKWLFKTKYNSDGSVQKHKARLVARGYVQEQGVDFDESFSPVARFETVRMIVALAAQLQWTVFQFDVKSAFLNGDLKEELYVYQPEGFVIKGEESKVYKLNKALYGLKQAPRAWVRQLIEEFKKAMMSKFEMTDMGKLSYFLGLEVHQSTRGIHMSQQKYATDLLKQFGMMDCKPTSTPMNINEKLTAEDGTGKADARSYRSLIGRLIYLTHTRPDLSFPVGLLSRFMHNPTKQHFGAAKRVLRYVAGTKSFGLWYEQNKEFVLKGYTDSDWAGSQDDKRSTSGNCFVLGSGVITWSSNKQATVALSSTEAEYVAATTAACQAVWLRRLLMDLIQQQVQPTRLLCDNTSAVALTRNPVMHGRTKHIELRHHFIRELVAREEVVLEVCRTEDQLADMLTKALPPAKFEDLRSRLFITSFESREDVES
ncbi:hypothetical protein L2E82_01471 [Cichorium intybus]|uniref:Uncharacterized protein n=1 Tax=Cichorium intybus TaxID=13427 RepID=A0ACB9GZS2_CICIN|nr:hypothetical protein L2E82_01471 [Cichorium intybus]